MHTQADAHTHTTKSIPLADRFEDVNPTIKSLREHHAIVLLVPPLRNPDRTFSEPSVLDGYLLPLLWDLQRYGPPLPDGPVYAERFRGPERMSLPLQEIGACAPTYS